MVVDLLIAPVQSKEYGVVYTGIVVNELTQAATALASIDTLQSTSERDSHLTSIEVEIGAVELVTLGKVGNAHAEVTQFVDWGRPFLEALELVDISVLLRGLSILSVSSRYGDSMARGQMARSRGEITHIVHFRDGKLGVHFLHLLLSVHKMEGKPIDGVIESNALPARRARPLYHAPLWP